MESLELVMQIKKPNSQVFIKAELKFIDQDLKFGGMFINNLLIL